MSYTRVAAQGSGPPVPTRPAATAPEVAAVCCGSAVPLRHLGRRGRVARPVDVEPAPDDRFHVHWYAARQLIGSVDAKSRAEWSIPRPLRRGFASRDADAVTGWAVYPYVADPHAAIFVPDQPFGGSGKIRLTIRLAFQNPDWMKHNLGRFRLSVTTNAGPIVADTVPKRVREILAIPHEKRSPAQVATVFNHWRRTVPEFAETTDQIEKLWKQWPEGTPSLTLVAREGRAPGDEKRPTHLLRRGDWLKPGNQVTAGVPSFLHPLPEGADAGWLDYYWASLIGIGVTFVVVGIVILALTILFTWGNLYGAPSWNSHAFPPAVAH